MPVLEIPPTPEHGQFRAVVGFSQPVQLGISGPSNVSGKVRIEPPFELNQDDYGPFADNEDMHFYPYASSLEATILDFELVDTNSIEAPQRITESVSSLLGMLGILSSKELFTTNWSQ